MAINKKQSSLVTKIGIGIVAVLLVLAFVPWDSLGLVGGGSSDDQSTGELEALAQQHSGAIAAYEQMLASEPTSYTVLVSLGNTYFDWAAGAQAAGTTGGDRPMWVSAAVYYERALAVQQGDPNVRTDLAVAYFNGGRTADAIAAGEAVRADNPDFAPVYYNLGIFYSNVGRTQDAADSMNTYLSLDPQGSFGNPDTARQIAGGGATTPATAAP